MRPITELESDTCRGLVGVAFDIDDTVTRAGRLELAAFRAMHELRGAGLRLIAVTGRPLGWVDVLALHWPVDAAVGENGAGWVWREGHVPREGYFEDEAARGGYPELLERVRRRVAEALPHVRTAIDQRARRCDLAFDVGETVRLPETEIELLLSQIEAEGARSAVSSVHAHAVPGDWDKARGVACAAADALAVDVEAERERWLFVGDSGNDAAGFAYFPVSVGVANVEHHLHRLPQRPRFVTRADRGRGFAELVGHILAGRGAAG